MIVSKSCKGYGKALHVSMWEYKLVSLRQLVSLRATAQEPTVSLFIAILEIF